MNTVRSCIRPGRLRGIAAAWMIFLSRADGQIPEPFDAPRPSRPEASTASYRLPEGFRMECVASEPLVSSPSGVCWDERGRLFVTELHGYNLEGQLDVEALNRTGRLDTEVRRVQADEKFKKAAEPGTYGVVKLLTDTDGDGRMDRAVVWSTNLPPAYGLVASRDGVIVACAPHVQYLADRDGDGRAEVREILYTGFRTGALERGINAPQWGVDGWIYFGRGAGGGEITGPRLTKPVHLPGVDFRVRPDGSAIEPVTGSTGTFGFALTTEGDRFTMSTIEPGRHVAPISWRYLVRNPDAAAPGLEVATGDRRVYPLAPAHPWRRKRAEHAGYFKYYRDRYGASDSDPSGWFTSACSPLIYEDDVLPGLTGHYLVCEPSGNLIHRARVERDGTMLALARVPEEASSEFAASGDPWSHPMNLQHGPDGGIWITDYYREIIEDYSAIPRHLQQQYGVYAGHDRGRIYRLTHRDARRVPPSDMSGLDALGLAREVGSPVKWRRLTAQRLLIERGERAAVPVLIDLAARRDAAVTARITALRTLVSLEALESEIVRSLFADPSESIRVEGLRLGEPWLADEGQDGILEAALHLLEKEKSPRVLLQLALTLGESADARALQGLARLVREHLTVRWMETAVLSSLRGRSVAMFDLVARDAGHGKTFLPALARTIAAGRDEAALARILEWIPRLGDGPPVEVLGGLVLGRKNSPRRPLTHEGAVAALAALGAHPKAEVRNAARSLEDTFLGNVADSPAIGGKAAAMTNERGEEVAEERFRQFLAALRGPRDPARGREVFLQACSICHRVGAEGHEVGPDLMGQIGMGDETLLKDMLMPGERVRPGYEATVAELSDGEQVTGILKDDGATSLLFVLASGVQQTLLRKDIVGVRRLETSLMPSFSETLTPEDAAHLLAWLRQAGRP